MFTTWLQWVYKKHYLKQEFPPELAGVVSKSPGIFSFDAKQST